MKNRNAQGERLRTFFSRRTFVFVDFLILVLLVVVFLIAWFAITRGSNVFVSGSFYTKGFQATYRMDGVTAEKMGGYELELRTVEEAKDTSTVEVTVGDETKTLVVERDSGIVLADTQTDVPLIYYYDVVREPGDVSKTFAYDTLPSFSTAFTGLEGNIYARVKKNNSDNVVMWYHRSKDKSYGPQFSWELPLFNDKNIRVGTIVNDLTSGILLKASFYEDGWGSINLTRTNYPTGLNRWAVFFGLNAILILWGIFHVLRARRHREEWRAHWSYFPLGFFGISRFFIRLLALTAFDFLGMGILTGNLNYLLVSDLIGLGLMIYAVGPFAFPVVFKFIPWIAAFGVFAGGRAIDYIQYPFGVPLYFVAVITYLLYRYLCYRKEQKYGLEDFLRKLPEVTTEAVLRELDRQTDKPDLRPGGRLEESPGSEDEGV